ncbi:TolC family protein [Hymenobacter sp. BT770]|uniref:TolC family protein n=1 Tax=Hymenobacter sp. BT770 TaxID=2886942 RepID=UPI001D0F7DF7|nr:TolC family protein [Hymenobacter sp. BT770]MCC3155129.1 TolC family protein [Hymenobacter sp. BT770]MDO3417148.1 TolC family protein [Hymenobacter sp. BT770]
MMRKTLAILLGLAMTPGWGQALPAKTDPEATIFFSEPAKVLPRLYEAAIKHSAEVARLEAGRGVATEDLKLSRKRLLNMVSVMSSYNYGSLPYFATADATSRPVYMMNPFSQGARAVYSAGVNLAVPLDLVAGRRSTQHRQELLVTKAEAERNEAEMKIRAEVIAQYQALVLARIGMQHYQDALQSASVNKKIADKKFREGEIQVSEQITAIDFYNKAALADAEAKNSYQTAVLLMENMIGMPINTLTLGK